MVVNLFIVVDFVLVIVVKCFNWVYFIYFVVVNLCNFGVLVFVNFGFELLCMVCDFVCVGLDVLVFDIYCIG